MVCHVDSGGRAQCNVVDPGEVARAVDRVRRDSAPVESALADVLRDPRLNEDERDQIIRTLLDDEDPNTRLPFFGHAGWRTGVGADPDSLSEDLRVIADALQGAYDRDVLKKDPDLLRIAGTFATRGGSSQSFDSAQRFFAVLAHGTATHGRDSVATALAVSLWSRGANGGADRAAAALYYLSDPALADAHLSKPADRLEAMKALSKLGDTAAAGLQRTIAAGGDPTAALAFADEMKKSGFAAVGSKLTEAAFAGVRQFHQSVTADVRKLAEHAAELTWMIHSCGTSMSDAQLSKAVKSYLDSKANGTSKDKEWHAGDAQLRDHLADDGKKLAAQIAALEQAPKEISKRATEAARKLLGDSITQFAIKTYIQTRPADLSDGGRVRDLANLFTAAKVADIGRMYVGTLAASYVRTQVLRRLEGLDLSQPSNVAKAKAAIASLNNETFRGMLGLTPAEFDSAIAAMTKAAGKLGGSADKARGALAELDKDLARDLKAFNNASTAGNVIRGLGLALAIGGAADSYRAMVSTGDWQNDLKLLVDAAGVGQQTTEFLMGVFARDTVESLSRVGGEMKLFGRIAAGETMTLMTAVLDGVSAVRSFGGLGVDQDIGNGVFSTLGMTGSILTVIGACTSYSWLGPVGMGVSAVAAVGKGIYDGAQAAHKYEGATKTFLIAGGYSPAAASALSERTSYAPFGDSSGSSPMPFFVRYAELKGISVARLQQWLNGLTPAQAESAATVMREIAMTYEGDASRLTLAPAQEGRIDWSVRAIDRALASSGLPPLPQP
jgi:hypothetical protein